MLIILANYQKLGSSPLLRVLRCDNRKKLSHRLPQLFRLTFCITSLNAHLDKNGPWRQVGGLLVERVPHHLLITH